jgi:hypothetical protein
MFPPTLAARIWSLFVIAAVLTTILIAPTWETVFAAALAVVLNAAGPAEWKVDFGLLHKVRAEHRNRDTCRHRSLFLR